MAPVLENPSPTSAFRPTPGEISLNTQKIWQFWYLPYLAGRSAGEGEGEGKVSILLL